MTGQSAVRRAEDIGGQELSYAEVKAIASGNPAVLTLAEADAELQRLTVLKKNHADEQYLARRSLRTLPTTIDSLRDRLAALTADRDTLAEHAGDRLILGDHAVARDDAVIALSDRLDALPWRVSQRQRFPLGQYRGLRFGIILLPQQAPEVYLEGAGTRDALLSREHHGPRAVLNALERLAGGYGSECERIGKDLDIAESQLRDYQARLGMLFVHEDYLVKLTALRDRLKAGLSGNSPEEDGETSVAELAERIKALRASNTVEAAPERPSSQRRDAGEEPVTARIRRRAEERATPDGENTSEVEKREKWQRLVEEQARESAERVREPG